MISNYKNPLFAERETLGGAIKFAHMLIESMPNTEKADAYTALYVVINTAAKVEQENLGKIAREQSEVLAKIDELREVINESQTD